jgi:hypothetical protein
VPPPVDKSATTVPRTTSLKSLKVPTTLYVCVQLLNNKISSGMLIALIIFIFEPVKYNSVTIVAQK